MCCGHLKTQRIKVEISEPGTLTAVLFLKENMTFGSFAPFVPPPPLDDAEVAEEGVQRYTSISVSVIFILPGSLKWMIVT